MNADTPYVIGGGLIAIIGLIMAMFAALRTKGGPTPVVPVAGPVEKEAAEVADKKITEAKKQETLEIEKATGEHHKVIVEVLKKEEKRVEEVDDGKAVNDFLKDVGKKVQT